MESINSQKDLYVEFLLDIYNAEILQITALRFFKEKVSDSRIRDLIHRHVIDTRAQMLRLEEIVEGLDESLMLEHCRTMKSMIDETKSVVARCSKPEIRDMAIAAGVQRINHCEIIVYRMLLSMADFIESDKFLELLRISLKEEEKFENQIKKMINFAPV